MINSCLSHQSTYESGLHVGFAAATENVVLQDEEFLEIELSLSVEVTLMFIKLRLCCKITCCN